MQDATPVLIQYGALGVMTVIALLVAKTLFNQAQADKARETARADRNEEALRELNRVIQERIIPAAVDMVATTKILVELIAEMRSEKRLK